MRVLPRSEWSKLEGTEAGHVWPVLDPKRSVVMVAEQDGQIIGTHVLMWVLHAECWWVSPNVKHSFSVIVKLWNSVTAMAGTLGAKSLATSILDDRLMPFLKRVGATKLNGHHFVVPIKDEPSCQLR